MREVNGICFNEAIGKILRWQCFEPHEMTSSESAAILLGKIADEAVRLLNEFNLNCDGDWLPDDVDEWKDRVNAFLEDVNA